MGGRVFFYSGIAIVFRGDRGLEPKLGLFLWANEVIAIVFRGDRGLEQVNCKHRSPLMVIAIVFRGDRGLELTFGSQPLLTILLRSSFGAIEDWNNAGVDAGRLHCRLRSSFGAIEDWNITAASDRSVVHIAIVFRGDRGLELASFAFEHLMRFSLRSSFGAIEDWND